jgi:hypothetical protein
MIFLLVILNPSLSYSIPAILLAIIIPLALLGMSLYFSLKKHMQGILILAIFITGAIIGLVVAWALIGFSLNIDRAHLNMLNFLVFIVVFLIMILITGLCYGSIKQFQSPAHSKRALRAFGAIAFGIIIVNGVAFGFFAHMLWIGNISYGTGYNDGPWSTWHDDPTTSITISWLTAKRNSSIVYYGTDPNDLSKTYQDSSNVFLHKAVLTGLTPNTTYYYRIPEMFDTPHEETIFRFKTAAKGSKYFRFAVLGDKQPTDANLLRSNAFVADGVIAQNYDFVTQVGDLASSGASTEDWHKTLGSLARIGARTPLMMTIGNHDFAGIMGATNWRQLFSYPLAGPIGSHYYSFDYGNAHFVMIDNFELLYQMSESQLNWIETDIKDAKARGQQWIFCFFHLSIFTTATSGFYYDLQKQLVPIFDKNGVDAAFYGHDHDYQHYNYTYGANGLLYSKDHNWDHNTVQYFCTGGGGANLEVGYGVLDMKPSVYEVEWYNTATQTYETVQYQKRPWNSSRYVTNAGFEINYTQYSADGKHDGKYYYHAPELESYCDFTSVFGMTYGEQAYHFLDVEIQDNVCIIRAIYPNGQVLSGPGGAFPQIYVLTK